MIRPLILALCLVFFAQISLCAQNKSAWNNKKCAVVLTYDDALHSHLDHVAPALDSLGLKGTFYLSGYFPGCTQRIEDWKKVATRGHELANHTLFHPCIGKRPGREWVSAERDMNNYSVQRMLDEIRMTNVFLQALDGKTKRTFAYTCGDLTVRDTSIVDKITGDFVSARGVQSEMYSMGNIDLFNVGSYMINGQSGDQLIALVKEAMKNNRLLVFLFHGVGGDHGLNVGLKEHSQLLHFLKDHEKEIWIAPFLEVTEFIKENQAAKK